MNISICAASESSIQTVHEIKPFEQYHASTISYSRLVVVDKMDPACASKEDMYEGLREAYIVKL